MKHLLFLVLVLNSTTIFAQKPPAKIEKYEVTYTFNEDQLAQMFKLVQVAQEGLPQSERISAKDANQLLQFSDSIGRVFIKQSVIWHPVPPAPKPVPVTPPAPIKDTTNKKAP
jgi:hypothetical protein